MVSEGKNKIRFKAPLLIIFLTSKSGRAAGTSHMVIGSDGNYEVNNDLEYKSWNNSKNNFAHLPMAAKDRFRVYLNGEKIWDLPKGFRPTSKYNAVTFATQSSYRQSDYFLLGNIRLAVGGHESLYLPIRHYPTINIFFNV